MTVANIPIERRDLGGTARRDAWWLQPHIVFVGLSVFVAAFFAYFVGQVNVETGQVFDGLGRLRREAPFLVRVFLSEERMWPGWFWFIGDLVWFWGGLFLAFVIASWGFGESNEVVDE